MNGRVKISADLSDQIWMSLCISGLVVNAFTSHTNDEYVLMEFYRYDIF